MKDFEQLMIKNKEWAASITETDADFFERLKHQQSPKYFWIGCSDSRVPSNQIVGLAPGEVFVHRNVANLFNNHDINAMSVLHYAVENLGITHILVCGHYDCGGVHAAMEESCDGMINDWLEPIRELAEVTKEDWGKTDDAHEQHNRLCELNVLKQVENLTHTTVIKKAWRKNIPLVITGVIYDVGNGVLNQVATVSNMEESRQLFSK